MSCRLLRRRSSPLLAVLALSALPVSPSAVLAETARELSGDTRNGALIKALTRR